MFLGWLLFWGCTKKEIEKDEGGAKLVLINDYSEGEKPQFRVENAQQKHIDTMLSSYKELQAYHGSSLSEDVSQVRFVGKDSPWKPEADKHYCIDTRSNESTEKEHIYYFANYCRSLSTLLRETNQVLESYIDIQTCEDLCACVQEKQLIFKKSSKTNKEQKNSRFKCLEFCKPKGWELTCESNKTLKKSCCMQ